MWAEQVTADNQSQIIHFDHSTKEEIAGYTVPEPLAPTPLDFTELPVGREATFPSPEPQQHPIFAPGPVHPSASLHELDVDSHEELKAKAVELNDDALVLDRDAEGVTAPVEPSESPNQESAVAWSLSQEPAASSSSAPLAFPSSDAPLAFPTSDAPVAFPSSNVPVAFPSDDASTREVASAPLPEDVAPRDSEDVSSPTTPAPSAPPPGVTFSQTESPRSETPDPQDSQKRKRISSQNFQRLARRISIGGRKATQQAADAVRAVTLSSSAKDKEVPRAGSPAPKESLASKMGFGRASSSKDDGSLRGSGGGSVRESGSFEITGDVGSGDDSKKLRRKSKTISKSKK